MGYVVVGFSECWGTALSKLDYAGTSTMLISGMGLCLIALRRRIVDLRQAHEINEFHRGPRLTVQSDRRSL